MSKELSKEIREQIEREALAGQKERANTDYAKGFNLGYETGYEAAGEKYAALWQAAEQWKKEAKLLLDPLLEWGQAQKDIPLGSSITSEILRRAKLYTAAEAKIERYEKALKLIEQMSDPGDYYKAICDMKSIATEALSPKTSSDECRL